MAGTQYVYDGTQWQAANTPPPTPADVVLNYGSSSNFIKANYPGARYVFAELISGGGGGYSGRGGGGGGGYASWLFNIDDLSATESVTVGAGGSASPSNSDGGTTSFAGISVLGGRKSGPLPSSGTIYTGGDGGDLDGVGAKGAFYQSASVYGLAANGGQSGGGGGHNQGATWEPGGDSQLGAGGGSGGNTSGRRGLGGLKATSLGALKAGDGGYSTTDGTAPGGGGGHASSGAAGAVRLTVIY